MQRLAQRPELTVGQVAKGATGDRAELERANPRPDQLEDRVADLVKHLAHDPVATLMDHDPDDRAVLGVTDRANHLGRRALAVNRDAAPEPVKHLRRRIAVQQGLVLFVDAVAGVHHAVRDLAVIRQQQQSLGLPVEPANRDDALVDRHEVHDGVAAAFVGCRCDVAAGLVQQDIAPTDGWDQLAVNLDLLGTGVNLAAEFGDDLAVDPHTPVEDQFLRAPSGCDAGRGQHSLQSFHVAVLSDLCRVRPDCPAAHGVYRHSRHDAAIQLEDDGPTEVTTRLSVKNELPGELFGLCHSH